MKPTLFILAAGMGSRYGGLKQMDTLGPNGETIIDYSIYDAVQAGFGKVVYIVREYFRQEFETIVRQKYANVKCIDGEPLQFVFVTQELDKIPAGFNVNPAGLSSCSGGLRPLVELCVEPAGLCRRCTGVAVPLRVVPSPTGLPSKRGPGLGPSQERTGESGAFGLWPHPRGSSRISS